MSFYTYLCHRKRQTFVERPNLVRLQKGDFFLADAVLSLTEILARVIKLNNTSCHIYT